MPRPTVKPRGGHFSLALRYCRPSGMQHHRNSESINIIIVYVMSWPKEGFGGLVGAWGYNPSATVSPQRMLVVGSGNGQGPPLHAFGCFDILTEKFRSRIW